MVRSQLEEAIAFYRQVDDPWHLAHALCVLDFCVAVDDHVGVLAEATRHFQRANKPYGVAWVWAFDHAHSQPHVQHIDSEDSVRIMREIGPEHSGLALALFCWGQKLYYRGDYQQALDQMEESIAIYRNLAERAILGTELILLGDTLSALGKKEGLAAIYQEAIQLLEIIGETWFIEKCQDRLDLLARGETIHKPYWIFKG